MGVWLTCHLLIFKVFISWLRLQFLSIIDVEVNEQLEANFPSWFNLYISIAIYDRRDIEASLCYVFIDFIL